MFEHHYGKVTIPIYPLLTGYINFDEQTTNISCRFYNLTTNYLIGTERR